MLGLLMMSVPLGFAVGLSAVALVRAEPDGVGRRKRGGYLGTKAAGSSMTVSLPHSLAWRFGQVTADGHLGKKFG